MQATAYTYDAQDHSGSVLLDDGTPLPFDGAAFLAGGLRLLRPGQRVRIETETVDGTADGADGAAPQGPTGSAGGGTSRRITLVTLQTF